jgi:endonuclease/exonuclease/phosphatase family metal-dependent hydrolase
MQYFRLRFDIDKNERPRVVKNLLALSEQLDRDIPGKDANDNLILGTWNIRDLGKQNRRGYGARIPESHFYIAEVLSRFDFVAVQEVNDLPEWLQIMDILGPHFDYIATDVTDTALGGNGERLTYLWDKRKVWFQKIAGEIVLPASMLISKTEVQPENGDDALIAGKQFRRTPFSASFQAGWFKFDICTVHLYYGEASGSKLQERIEEINAIAKYLAERAQEALKKDRAIILLGDFNIVHPDHKTMQALTSNGFVVPKALAKPTNIDKTKHYDQIAFMTDKNILEYVEKKSNAGIFEIFESVFRDDAVEEYKAAARLSSNGKNKKDGDPINDYYLDWRTYQMSDHKPMWVRLQVNNSKSYLESLTKI